MVPSPRRLPHTISPQEGAERIRTLGAPQGNRCRHHPADCSGMFRCCGGARELESVLCAACLQARRGGRSSYAARCSSARRSQSLGACQGDVMGRQATSSQLHSASLVQPAGIMYLASSADISTRTSYNCPPASPVTENGRAKNRVVTRRATCHGSANFLADWRRCRRAARFPAIAAASRGLSAPLPDCAPARVAATLKPFSFPTSAASAFWLPDWIVSAPSP